MVLCYHRATVKTGRRKSSMTKFNPDESAPDNLSGAFPYRRPSIGRRPSTMIDPIIEQNIIPFSDKNRSVSPNNKPVKKPPPPPPVSADPIVSSTTSGSKTSRAKRSPVSDKYDVPPIDSVTVSPMAPATTTPATIDGSGEKKVMDKEKMRLDMQKKAKKNLVPNNFV